jgi:hypothetical protein
VRIPFLERNNVQFGTMLCAVCHFALQTLAVAALNGTLGKKVRQNAKSLHWNVGAW